MSYFCNEPWDGIFSVQTNRDVTFCPCYLQMRIGNLDESTMAEIWNGEPLLALRRSFIARELPEVCGGQLCPVAVEGGDRGAARDPSAADVLAMTWAKPAAAPLPFVSILIPTRNRARQLQSCLAHLSRQDYPADRFEIIVADDGSRDETASIVRAAQRGGGAPVQYLRQAKLGANHARNVAYCAAIGDPVCLVDDDVEPPSGWLRALTGAALDHPEIGCVGGPMLLRLDWVAPTKCEGEEVGESELDLGDRTFEVRYVWGGNMAVRRHAVDKVGMFQEHRRCGNDEVEWMDRLHQAGLSVLYVGSAPVIHRRVADDLRLGHLARRRFLRGMGQSAAYYQAGYAYRVEAQWAGLRERSGHAADHRCTTSALEASQLAGRLVALAALRLRDRVRGRTIALAPPPG